MPDEDDLSYLTAAALGAQYARGALSPVEVVRATLARIARVDPRVNAFVVVDADGALEAARAAEARFLRGEPLGPLDGVPFSVKDLLDARGLPTRRGSRAIEDVVARDDAPAVARLREGGAVLLGKTTTTEFGLRGGSDSPLTGVTRNPFDLAHATGGSSAGAVAATAAGLGAIAIGTDGGGSIRIPSAYTGVAGLKPTFGRVPNTPPTFVGAPPLVGPIARDVADLALALRVIARADPRDPFRAPIDDFTFDPAPRSLAGLRIASSATLGGPALAPAVAAAFARALDVLRDAGATVEEADPDLPPSEALIARLFATRAADTLRSLPADKRHLVDPAVARAAAEGERVSAAELLAVEAERVLLAQAAARFHTRFDLLVTPAIAASAPPLTTDLATLPRNPFASPFSLTRQPALSVPTERDAAGLPLAIQIVGRHFDEASVLRAGLAVSAARPFVRPTHD
ncbi:MAG: amidase family protein [Polyangiales bacterium]